MARRWTHVVMEKSVMMVMLTGVIVVTGFAWGVGAQEFACCSVVSGSCRNACSKVSLAALAVASAEDTDSQLTDVLRFCPQEMTDFWQCLNRTLEEVSSGAGWGGRACCGLPQALACRRACATASSLAGLRQASACRLSDELAFFACVDRQQAGDECCVHARSAECSGACLAVFRAPQTPSREARAHATHACAQEGTRLTGCLRNATRTTPATNAHRQLHCCDKTDVPGCREACRRVLRTATEREEIVDALEHAGCGPPLPHAALWQCFLLTPSAGAGAHGNSRIDSVGMDAAKLHCCSKASRDACRRLCLRTFSNDWTRTYDEFHRTCLAHLSEDALAHCLDEVEEPCELGCDGLNYCTNFNNRPTELFRSCGRAADDAARLDVNTWTRKGELSLPGAAGGAGLRLPLRNLSSCSPRRWRAVACSLQLRPCHAHTHTNRICRDDCYDLLSQCVDWGRARAMPGSAGLSAATVCSQLSPDNPTTPCVSLQPFLAPSERRYWPPQDALLAPCRGEPCNGSQACLVNRNCPPGRPCLPYACVPGCRLGEVSHYVVPQGTYVRLLQGSGAKDCPKVCQCSAGGALERCQPLSCVYYDPCLLSDHQKIAHNAWFYLGCNICTCYSGEVTCSKRQCEEGAEAALEGQEVAFASLPCRCPSHHVPVCGRNGNTYPSSCLARCAGLTDVDFEFGPCSSRDPCAQVQCPQGQRCVPARKTCLSLQYRSCPQHQCVDVASPCSAQPHEPVCDSDGVEHPNPCYLLKKGKALAYRGPCLEGCAREGVVCGADGNSYASECAAWAARAPVDYAGPCVAVGFVSDAALPQCAAAGVRCPPLPSDPLHAQGSEGESGGGGGQGQAEGAGEGDGDGHCEGLTPPGACCPVCAGAIRLLYSYKQVDRILYSLKGGGLSALTVHAVLAALERQVQVAECSVRGYMTVELDLIALVVPAGRGGRPASPLQREACAREAEKLASLVQRTSPRVLSELSLSVLTTASVAHAPVPAAAGLPAVLRPPPFALLAAAILFATAAAKAA